MLGFAIVAAVLYALFMGMWTLPHDESYPLFLTINEVRDWVEANRDALVIFDAIREGIGGARRGLRRALPRDTRLAGDLGVVGAFGAIFGGWRLATLAVGRVRRTRPPGPLGVEHGDPRPDARRGPDRARSSAMPLGIVGGRSKRVRGVHHADPRRHADHADVRLPGAHDAALRHRRPGRRRSRRSSTRSRRRSASRHSGSAACTARRWRRPCRSAPPDGRSCARSSSRWPDGPSGSASTRRS